MEPVDVPWPATSAFTPTSSRSSSISSWRSALPSPSQSPTEWPFSGLRPSHPSSRSSSSWPFATERPRSLSPSSFSISSNPWWPYRPVPAKDWVGVYPPVLPPPDFFDLEEQEKWIKEEMFKKDNIRGPLHDETGKVDLPIDEKGILILDPESRTRIIDASVDMHITEEFFDWISSAIIEAEELGGKQTVDWLLGLQRAVDEDFKTVAGVHDIVLYEERKKRGLTDWGTFTEWARRTQWRLLEGLDDEEDKEDKTGYGVECHYESLCPFGASPYEGDRDMEDEACPDNSGSTLQDDGELPETLPQSFPVAESFTTREPSQSLPPLDLFALWG